MKTGVKIFTSSTAFELSAASGNQEQATTFVRLLYQSFGSIIKTDGDRITIQNCILLDKKTKQNVKHFLSQYAENSKQIYGAINAIEKINSDEYIAIFPLETLFTQKVEMQIFQILRSINSNAEESSNGNDEIGILDTYKIEYASGEKTKKFGCNDENNGQCRYCKKYKPQVSYKSKSHLIPEGLGNKASVSKDECDACNTYFGQTIDRDIILYFSIFRPTFGIKGSNGTPQVKGRNFSMCNTPDGVSIKLVKDYPHTSEDDLPELKLIFNEKITLQNIYRSLCKYAIGMIDNKEIHHFENTISWIRYNIHQRNLPKVAKLVGYSHFSKFPQLIIYKRIPADDTLPLLVGEFHFTCVTLVFIVPQFDGNVTDFCDNEQYTKFWEHFSHFSKHPGWVFEDFSCDSPNEFQLNLKFSKDEKEAPPK